MFEYKKIDNIDEFITKNKQVLDKIPAGNCYFANLVVSALLRNLNPTTIFGSLLGFCYNEMIDSRYFLSCYVDYYFNQTWGIQNEFLINIPAEDCVSVQKFKEALISNLKYKDWNCLVGLCMAAENVHYREDIDLNFWGKRFIYHFSLCYNFDFENDRCMLLDATPSKDKNQKYPISQAISITELLDHARMHEEFILLLDTDALLDCIVSQNNGHKGMVERNINSIIEQAQNRLHKTDSNVLSPIEWIKNEWKTFESVDSSVWKNWFDPRLNMFNTIIVHRYYVPIFIEQYLKEYCRAPIDRLLKLLKQEEEGLEKLKYLSYKLSVCNNRKNVVLLKNNIDEVLGEVDSLELEIAEFILKNVKR